MRNLSPTLAEMPERMLHFFYVGVDRRISEGWTESHHSPIIVFNGLLLFTLFQSSTGAIFEQKKIYYSVIKILVVIWKYVTLKLIWIHNFIFLRVVVKNDLCEV